MYTIHCTGFKKVKSKAKAIRAFKVEFFMVSGSMCTIYSRAV